MTVYVDAADWTTGAKNPRQKYAHLVATTVEELHEFARSIGIKSHFFHKTPRMHHYDVTAAQQKVAIEHGAVLLTTKELLLIAKEMTCNSTS